MFKHLIAVCAVSVIGLRMPHAAAAPAFTVKKNIPYLETANGPSLDMYTPAGASGAHRVPGFVWIHGGGWTGGDKGGDREVAVCTTLVRAGFLTVSINYVLADSAHKSWPTNLEQCKAAVRFLRHYGALYGVDTANIAVGGGSAGAHLAAMVGFTGEARFLNSSYAGYSGKVKAVLDMYGPVSTYDWYGASVKALLGITSKSDPLIAQSSVETYISADSPPVFITHGLSDVTVDPVLSENFDKRLTAAGAEHRLVMIPGAVHSFTLETSNGKPLSVDLKPMVLDWLNSKLRPTTALAPTPAPGRASNGAANHGIGVRVSGTALEPPSAWGEAPPGGAPAGEVTLELRERDGRLLYSRQLPIAELSGPGFADAAAMPVRAAGLYFLIVRQGGRSVAALVARAAPLK